MNTKLVIIGNIFAISAKEYKEEKNVYAQFLNKTETGGAEIIKVKMTDEYFNANFDEMPNEFTIQSIEECCVNLHSEEQQ